MAMLIDEKAAGVDKNKCIKMAIVHDLAESLVGDITPYDGVTIEDKHTQERVCHMLFLSAAIRNIQCCGILRTGDSQIGLDDWLTNGRQVFFWHFFLFNC